MSERIALIDSDSILYSAFYGNKVVDDVTGEPKKEDGKFVIVPKTDEQIMETLDGIFHHIFTEGKFTHYIIFVKGNNTTVDRLEANPEYKQHRTKEIPEKWEFTKQYAIEKWGAIEVNDIEVDDAIRICSRNMPNSYIVAIDKDLLWLSGENFNWRKNEWTYITPAMEEMYFCRSMIVGDTVDNIKGIPGKGEKYCIKNNIDSICQVLNEYINEYGASKGVNEFYKNFKALYILEESDKFTQLPTPIKIEYDNGENRESRSTAGNLSNT